MALKKVAIIGGGVTGLSAGIHARRNGYDATIFEMHYLPGGMCTSWQRRGFSFEGCLHYIQLTGSSPQHFFFNLWKELGVFPAIKMIPQEVFHSFRDLSGRTFHLFADADRLEEELLRHSPGDADEVRALAAAVRTYSWFVRSAGRNPIRLLRKGAGMLRGLPLFWKYGSMNLGEYASRFRDPLLREALTDIFGCPEFACISLFFILAGWHLGGTAYPQGGSLALAKAIEGTFLGLGGEIRYRSKVQRILVEDGRAAGVELNDGSVERADIVVSAADGRSTLVDLLGGRFTPQRLRDRYATKPLYPAFIQVSLGVDLDLSAEPHALKVQLRNPFQLAGRTRRELWLHHFACDPTAAPSGKTALAVLYPTDWSWWEQFPYGNRNYEKEKERILAATIAHLEEILPGISSRIEVSDVSTPYTMHRYTGNWRGSPGFVMTKELAGEMTLKTCYTLPGLDRFYMAGQWVKGFGVPMAALSGREVVQAICRADRRRFRAV